MNKAGWSLLDHFIGEFLYVIIIKTRVREIDQSCQTWPAKDWHKISNLQYKINEDIFFTGTTKPISNLMNPGKLRFTSIRHNGPKLILDILVRPFVILASKDY
jgi:hypothetical protein